MANDPQQVKMTKEIERTLEDEKQLVEVIRNSKQTIIGYNIYQLADIKRTGKIYLYCNLSMLIKEYRELGITPVIMLRYALALQQLFPQSTIGVFILAVHPNSYRLVTNYLHWPMYQPHYLEKELLELMCELNILKSTNYSHDILTCYVAVDNQLEVKKSAAVKKAGVVNKDGMETNGTLGEFFYLYLLGQMMMDDSCSKAVPVLFFISDLTYCCIKQLCDRLEIKLEDHVGQLAPLFNEFLKKRQLLPERRYVSQNENYFSRSQLLFWCNKKVPSALNITPYKKLFVSKL
jgi:hypothetical protein